jgi:hypothetical protein
VSVVFEDNATSRILKPPEDAEAALSTRTTPLLSVLTVALFWFTHENVPASTVAANDDGARYLVPEMMVYGASTVTVPPPTTAHALPVDCTTARIEPPPAVHAEVEQSVTVLS